MVMHAYNFRRLKQENHEFQGQPELHEETLNQKYRCLHYFQLAETMKKKHVFIKPVKHLYAMKLNIKNMAPFPLWNVI
jgi:hypothetical protein